MRVRLGTYAILYRHARASVSGTFVSICGDSPASQSAHFDIDFLPQSPRQPPMPPQGPSSPDPQDLRSPSPSPDQGTLSKLWSPPCSCKHYDDRIQALRARVRYLESRVSSLYYLADSLERLYRLVTPERPTERQPIRPGQRPLRTTTTVPPDCVDGIYELARASKDLGDEINQLWCDNTWDLF